MRQATINPHRFRALLTVLVALASAVGELALVMVVGPNRVPRRLPTARLPLPPASRSSPWL